MTYKLLHCVFPITVDAIDTSTCMLIKKSICSATACVPYVQEAILINKQYYHTS